MLRQTCEISMWRPVSHCCFSLVSRERRQLCSCSGFSSMQNWPEWMWEPFVYSADTHTETNEISKWSVFPNAERKRLYCSLKAFLITVLLSSQDHCCFCRALWESTPVQVTKQSLRWWEGQPQLQLIVSRIAASLIYSLPLGNFLLCSTVGDGRGKGSSPHSQLLEVILKSFLFWLLAAGPETAKMGSTQSTGSPGPEHLTYPSHIQISMWN